MEWLGGIGLARMCECIMHIGSMLDAERHVGSLFGP